MSFVSRLVAEKRAWAVTVSSIDISSTITQALFSFLGTEFSSLRPRAFATVHAGQPTDSVILLAAFPVGAVNIMSSVLKIFFKQ